MSRKLTKREKFLKIIERDKYYRGDSKFTVKLYKKFLLHYKKYGTCTSTALFECVTVRNRLFFINRGYTNAEAIAAVQQIQSRGYNARDHTKVMQSNVKRALTLDKKSLEEKERIKKLKGLGYSKEHISLKYNISLDEADRLIQERKIQKVDSYKHHLKQVGGYKREWSCRCAEFWIKRGFSEDEAKEIISRRSDSRSLHSIVNRLGVSLKEAKEIQKDVSRKCRDTFNNRTEEEKREIVVRRTKHFKRYSRASVEFFELLMRDLRHLNLTWLYGENEYFLWDKDHENKKIYFYDLTLPEINTIIEYNGVIFHPRVQDTWAITVAESVAKDNIKEKLAEAYNFKVYYVWENEDKSIALERIQSIIKQKYDSRAN
jgi:hypothetical protein